MNQLLIALILSVLPVFELRGGLPLAINYSLKNNVPIFLVFSLVIFLNILVIFLIFLFLDYLHAHLIKFKFYNKIFNFYIKRIRKKAEKIEKKIPESGYLALTLFVAIPLPVTGAWTGTFIAWLLGLERKKSILAISLGVLIAGIFVLLATLGFFNLFS